MLRGFAIYVIFVLKIISESGGDQDMGQDSMWGVGSEARLRFESRVRVGVPDWGPELGSGAGVRSAGSLFSGSEIQRRIFSLLQKSFSSK